MKYTTWYKWQNRKKMPEKKQYGIYYICHTSDDIEGSDFNFNNSIIYIGRNISNRGVAGRLDQFKKAMDGKNNIHGGAERVRFKHNDADHFFENAYVACCVFPTPCEKDTAADLIEKGKTLQHEYVSMSTFVQKFGYLPEFNDMKKSKKK